MTQPDDVREYLVERLRRDLVGPHDMNEPAEILRDYPADKYLTGILFPRQLAIPQEEDDELPAADDDGTAGDEAAVPLSQCARPASLGLSFTVQRVDGQTEPPSITVRVSAARYVKRWASKENTEELIDEERKAKEHVRWQRVPPPEAQLALVLEAGRPDTDLSALGLSGLTLHLRVAANDRGAGATVVLINGHKDEADRDLNEMHSWYQTSLTITPGTGCEFVGRKLRRDAITLDDQTAALIYRDFLEYAVGHTCSAVWSMDAGRVKEVRSEWVPTQTVDATSADGDAVFDSVRNHATLKPFSATWLSEATRDDLLAALALVPEAYGKWIERQTARISGLPTAVLRAYAGEHRKLWERAHARMRQAIEWLANNEDALASFQYANRAMQLQRQWSRGQDLAWRPFQVAFQLLVLESTLQAWHPDREMMDLLWFPTGGGKTEAYLGVIAMVLFYRRLTRATPDEGAGVNVIMRYTLRVLTTQQFERAAYLVCACEHLRHSLPLATGEMPFSIGLWVGSSATPNSVAEAHQDPRRAMQIKKCPCCRTRLIKLDDSTRFAVRCPNAECELGRRLDHLPIWTVDQDIYRELPSLLIGTIDKFAQLARRRETGSLFGIGTPIPHAPPDLIIQDELHLISGPLGTIAGLYEIAVDAFCSSHGAIPKLIGSTATIKMAKEQVRALFNRDVFQFPPPGLEEANSCFAVRDAIRTGRLYLGITTAGRSAKFTLQACCASLLQAAASPRIPVVLSDSYWTLVAYFNALRELGGAHVLLLDDVPKSIGEYAGRYGEASRRLNEPAELTSRLSQTEIPEVLERLSQGKATGRAEDTLLSTNMISVGVDIPRLALMLVNGQPKSIAEYIQATSRVGRDVVAGLVLTAFNSGKPRDRSFYETFCTWHGTLYRDVEATSVTPFAARSVDKALRAVLVAMVRHLIPEMATNPVLTNARRPRAEQMRDLIVKRVIAIDPAERIAVERRLNIILDEWQARMSLEQYWVEDKGAKSLLLSAERVASLKASGRPQSQAWAAPNSMREVEPGTHFRLQ